MPAPSYKPGEQVATREAWGTALAALGAIDRRVVALDADVKNSTFSDRFEKAFPDRFYENFIAEQVMVGAAMGLAARGAIAFASTFACFLTRAADFIRMAGLSNARLQLNVKLTGSHAGISIGEDGPSQMALEDLAMMRAVPDCAVLYPVRRRQHRAAGRRDGGVSRPGVHAHVAAEDRHHLRSRREVPDRRIEGALSERDRRRDGRGGRRDRLRGAQGVRQLKGEGIQIRVIDAYSVQPIDAATLIAAGKATNGVIITVEDHYAPGGLGDAVSEAVAPAGLAVHRLAVREMPRSGQAGRAPRSLRHFRQAHHRRRAKVCPEVSSVSRTCARASPRVATLALTLAFRLRRRPAPPRGAREPAWAPDGRRLAFSYLDRIWLSAPDGRNGKALRPETSAIERDPAWSTDGRSIVFAADTGQGFDLVVVPSNGGDARHLTTLPGDERWPSWTVGWARRVFSPGVRPMAAVRRRRRRAASRSRSSPTRPETTSSRAAYRRTASASPTSPIATATTATATSGWLSLRPARAIA